MKNEELNTDKSIREKLEGFSADPPAHVWTNIQGQMAAIRRRKRVAIISWSAAAAVVVFAFIAGWMFNERSDVVLPDVVEHQQIDQQPEQRTGTETAEQPQPDMQNTAEERGRAIVIPESTSTSLASQRALVAQSNVSETKQENALATTRMAEEYKRIEMLSARFVHAENDKLNVRRKKIAVTEVERALSESDRALIVANLQTKSEDKEEQHGWVVGAHVSPGYASHSASYSTQYSYNMNEVSGGGVSNTGGGLSVQYKTGKRLSIESGVYYAQNSQSAGSSNRLFAFAPSYDMSNGLSEGADQPSFANAVEVTRNGISMNSTAGVVNMRSTPRGAEINAVTDASKAVYSTTLVADGEFSQVFDLVEIPLYLRYKLLNKKFGFDVLGGLNAGLVVGNNAYIQNNFGKQNIGSTEDISTLNISGTIGVGFSYAVGRHFSLAMEPRFNYYLNSINTSPDVDYKPYRIGLFTGVYYAF